MDNKEKKSLSAAWLEAHQNSLQTYVNEWVAIGADGVYAHDASMDKVIKNITNPADTILTFVLPPAPKNIKQ